MERFTEKIMEDYICNRDFEVCEKQNKNPKDEDCCCYCEINKKMRNKLGEYEDLEEQGLLVKIECHCKDCVHWFDGVAGATEHVKLCTIGTYMTGKNGYCLYAEKKVNKYERNII